MLTNYANTTWLQLQQMLALRLNDPAFVRWTQAEMQLYLAEALRLWNALTQQWLVEWTITYDQPNPATLPAWQSTANDLNTLVGANPTSPRTQTLTDSGRLHHRPIPTFLKPPKRETRRGPAPPNSLSPTSPTLSPGAATSSSNSPPATPARSP